MTCKTCLIEHDAATHAATQRVHQWLKRRLALVLGPVPVIKQRLPVPVAMAGIRELRSPSARRKAASK